MDRSFPLHVYHNSVFLYTLAIFVEQSRFYRFFNVLREEPELLISTYFLLNVLMTDQLGLSKPVSLTSVIYYRGKRSVNTAVTILLGKQ